MKKFDLDLGFNAMKQLRMRGGSAAEMIRQYLDNGIEIDAIYEQIGDSRYISIEGLGGHFTVVPHEKIENALFVTSYYYSWIKKTRMARKEEVKIRFIKYSEQSDQFHIPREIEW